MKITRGRLKKEIGASELFTFGFGTIIGVAWIVVMGSWLDAAGPLGAILAFALGGLVMMLVGLCYAEISTMIPVAGGEMAYAYEIFGTRACFAMGWFLSLAYIATTSFEAVSLGWIAGTLVPGIEGVHLYSVLDFPIKSGTLTLGLLGMGLLTLLNYRGGKLSGIFQDIITYGKMILYVVFISAGIFWGKTTNLEPLFRRSDAGSIWPGILAVFMTAPFWYAGFNVIPQLLEEKSDKTSLKLAGRVIVLSVVVAIFFYCLLILSPSMIIPWQKLTTFSLPAADAFRAAFNSSFLVRAILLAGLLGNITAWNGCFICASRLLFALGRGQILRPSFGAVHPSLGSPVVAVAFVGVVGGLGVFLGKSAIVPIVNVASTCFALAFLLISVGVIKMRIEQPDRLRPYRVPGGVFTAVASALASLFVLFLTLYQPYQSAKGPIPIEWMFLAGWAIFGWVCWVAARKVRGRVSEADRRKLILGVEAPTAPNAVSQDAEAIGFGQ
jgi:APA family basic amino acid/polyamine antiporter